MSMNRDIINKRITDIVAMENGTEKENAINTLKSDIVAENCALRENAEKAINDFDTFVSNSRYFQWRVNVEKGTVSNIAYFLPATCLENAGENVAERINLCNGIVTIETLCRYLAYGELFANAEKVSVSDVKKAFDKLEMPVHLSSADVRLLVATLQQLKSKEDFTLKNGSKTFMETLTKIIRAHALNIDLKKHFEK